MLFSTGVSFLLLTPFTKMCIRLVEIIDYHLLSVIAFFIVVPAVYAYTGGGGLAIMTVATGIGLLPVLFQARRMNLMAVLLFPVTVSMAGYGDTVLRFLGLL